MKNQSMLITIIIVAIGMVMGYIFYLQTDTETEILINTQGQGTDGIDRLSNLSVDFSIFDDERLKALQIFGELPVSPGITGRKDIFAPI
jgi:hypothetical protein